MATFQVNGVDISRYTIVYGTNEAIQAVYDYGAPRDENDNVITPTFYYRGDCVRDAGILRDTISAKLGVTLPAISDQSPKAEY